MKTAAISKKTMLMLACTLASSIYTVTALPADCPEGGVSGTEGGDNTATPPDDNYATPPEPTDGAGGEDAEGEDYPTPSPPADCPDDSGSDPEAPSDACPVDMHYAAALFQQANYSGIHSWADGKESECRGLNGTDIFSVKIVGFNDTTQTSGDIVFDEASDDFAKGVSLTFFDDFDCGGAEISTVDGTQSDVSVPKAKSVKIGCNGLGSGVFTAKEVSPVYPLAVTDEDGAQQWFSGVVNECRGMEGNPFKDVQFLTTDGSDPTVAENQADVTGVALRFFPNFGCDGAPLEQLADAPHAAFDPAVEAKSFMFISTVDDGSQMPMSESGAAQLTAGISLLATAFASLIFA